MRAPTRPHGRDFYRADAGFTASVGKTASAGKCGRGRTSERKGRPDGHFHPKTSVMTSLDMDLKKIAALVHQMLQIEVDFKGVVKAMEEILPSMRTFGSTLFSLYERYFFAAEADAEKSGDTAHVEKSGDAADDAKS
jgi:hypothetical protein